MMTDVTTQLGTFFSNNSSSVVTVTNYLFINHSLKIVKSNRKYML